jgi:hypothetical protein
VEPLTRGLPFPNPHSLCTLSSTEFVEPPHRKKIPGVNPPKKIHGYATDHEERNIGGIKLVPHILNLDTRYRQVVHFDLGRMSFQCKWYGKLWTPHSVSVLYIRKRVISPLIEPQSCRRRHGPIYLAVTLRPSLCLTEHHAMKSCRGVDVQLRALLASTLNGYEKLASGYGHFTFRIRTSGPY